MEVDFERPPARLGPRWPAWLTLVIVWVADLVVTVVVFNLADQPASPGVFVLTSVLLASSIVLLATAAFYVRSGRSRLLVNRWWTGQAYPQDDPGDYIRLIDREEGKARRQLRDGVISRATYERTIARREFVHGELSRAEYHARIARINEEEAEQLTHPRISPRSDRPSG